MSVPLGSTSLQVFMTSEFGNIEKVDRTHGRPMDVSRRWVPCACSPASQAIYRTIVSGPKDLGMNDSTLTFPLSSVGRARH